MFGDLCNKNLNNGGAKTVSRPNKLNLNTIQLKQAMIFHVPSVLSRLYIMMSLGFNNWLGVDNQTRQ